MIKVINTESGVGAYSQAIIYNDLIFCSGQISINPKTGKIERGTIADQTKRAMDNLKLLLSNNQSNLEHVLKTTIYLSDMSTFDEMNKVYASYFKDHYPARLTVEAGGIYGDLGIEIEAVAAVKK